MDGERRKAAVLGSPIAHSRSPQLHLAAYRALGLDWTYERIECDAERLPGLVDGLGPEWVGLSVTMPGKVAALEYATERTERAELVGSANTLLRIENGWRADCTDVDGVRGALEGAGVKEIDKAVVLGAGGTARPALLALAELGAHTITIVARSPAVPRTPWNSPSAWAFRQRSSASIRIRSASSARRSTRSSAPSPPPEPNPSPTRWPKPRWSWTPSTTPGPPHSPRR